MWKECYRVLLPGRRVCINIGNQFARAVICGQYKVIPLYAEIIAHCERVGFDYMGAIIWQKRTTMRPAGGAVVMGSFPYLPKGIVELDYEYILLFRKPGRSSLPALLDKEALALTRDEWKQYFCGQWIRNLRRYGVGKPIRLRYECPPEATGRPLPAYVYLSNRLFINRKMIESGLAVAEGSIGVKRVGRDSHKRA